VNPIKNKKDLETTINEIRNYAYAYLEKYSPSKQQLRTYLFKKFLKKNNCKIIFEPGRSIIVNAGILISKIIYIKKNKNKIFVILDAAMNDLMRPALYGAQHQIIPLRKTSKNLEEILNL